MACETLNVEKIRCYCYPFRRLFWIGWVTVKCVDPLRTLYYDNEPIVTVYPEEEIKFATVGFAKNSVLRRLKKYVEKIDTGRGA